MYKPVPNTTLDLAMVVPDEVGMPVIRWVEPVVLLGRKETPAYACTVIGFDDTGKRDAFFAQALESRGNATVCTTSSPARGGPHVVLQVHLDRPTEPAMTYDEAVTRVYDGRGRVYGTIEGGQGTWTTELNSDRGRTGFLHRPHPDGYEVAWQLGRLGESLDQDLADKLTACLREHGLRLLGEAYVGRVYPGSQLDALRAARKVESIVEAEMERLSFAGSARETARILMSDPAVPRLLKRLDKGCLVMWGENHGEWLRLSSYQVRPGDPFPYKVSGDHVRTLMMLRAVERIWEPTRDTKFYGCPWSLVQLSDRGRMLLAGDIVGGVEEAQYSGSAEWWSRKRVRASFLEAVQVYADELSGIEKEALLDGMSFPGQCQIQVKGSGSLTPEMLNLVLIGLITGSARVTDDGKLKAVKTRAPKAPAPKRSRASGPSSTGPL